MVGAEKSTAAFSPRAHGASPILPTSITRAARPCSPYSYSLDHLVGNGEQFVRYRQAERFRGLQIDCHFEPDRLYARQIRRLFALEYSACIDADLTDRSFDVGSLAHAPPIVGVEAAGIHCRQA